MTESCSVLLDQLTLLLRQISPEDYKKKLRILNGSSVGQHVRHTLEFYICLTDQHRNGNVNYDLRARDIRLESDPLAALEKIKSIRKELSGITCNRNLTLFTAGQDIEEIAAPSSMQRELIYVNEHAVHHLAIIKSGLFEIPEIELPDSFGVASSTLLYRKKNPQHT